MKKWIVLAGLTLFLSACGGGDDEMETPEMDNGTDDEQTAEVGDYDEGLAEQTYQQSCIQCHGDQMQGASGPALVNNNLTSDEIADILVNGQGSMPPQSQLSDDEVDNLSHWLADQ